MKGLWFHSTCNLNKLACHSFMNAGGKHKAPESETRDCITHSSAGSKNSMGVCFSCTRSPLGVAWMCLDYNHTSSELVTLQERTLSWGNLSLFLRFYVCIFRETGREGERGEKHPCKRETSTSCLSYLPDWGPNLQPRCVTWPGIRWATFHSARWHPANWATPIEVGNWVFYKGQ